MFVIVYLTLDLLSFFRCFVGLSVSKLHQRATSVPLVLLLVLHLNTQQLVNADELSRKSPK